MASAAGNLIRIRQGFTPGGIVAGAAEGLAKGVGSAFGGIASGLGSAVQGAGEAIGGIAKGAGSALGGALEGALRRPDTIINNFGMAGQAGQATVTRKRVAAPGSPLRASRPQKVSNSMSTEKLLVVAVNYLSSIDNTLRTQINYERRLQQNQQAADRESRIESTGGLFSNFANKFNGGKQKTGNEGVVKGILSAAAIFGVVSLAGMTGSELSALNEKMMNFGQNIRAMADRVIAMGAQIGAIMADVGKIWLVMQAKKLIPMGAGMAIAGKAGAGGVIKFGKDVFSQKPPIAEKPMPFERGKIGRHFGDISTAESKAAVAAENESTRALNFLRSKTSGRFIEALVNRSSPRSMRFYKFIAEKAPAAIAKKFAIAVAAAEASAVTDVAATAAAIPTGGTSWILALIMKVIDLGLWAWLAFDCYQLYKEFEKQDGKNQKKKGPSLAATQPAPSAAEAAPDAYNVVYGFGKYGSPSKPLTDMTIAEVLEFQQNTLLKNGPNSPVGAYQINKATLMDLAPSVLGSDWQSQKFTPAVQDRLAEALFNARKGGDLSKTWSSMAGKTTPGQYANSEFSEVRNSIIQGEVGSGSNQKGFVEEVKDHLVDSYQGFMRGIRAIGSTDTTFVPMSGNSNAADKIKQEQIALEAALTTGLNTKSAASKGMAQLASLSNMPREMNGGRMDVINPNYKMDDKSIVSNYILAFGAG
jgi:hypothetical protein